MSTHAVRVILITEVRPHTNADALEIIPINGWQVVARKGSFNVGDLAVYIEPDYVVPTDRAEFAFLAKAGKSTHRLRALRLRGELSFGLLLPITDVTALDGAIEPGDDVMELLGITRYVPPQKYTRGGGDELALEEGPKGLCPKFDIESLANYPTVLSVNETVLVTEKVHGANARYVVEDGTFYMGSRNRWLKSNCAHAWKSAADADPRIEAWCRAHPGVFLFGEVYGAVQSLKYGTKNGEIKFVAFAALDHDTWLDTAKLHNDATLPTTPLLYHGTWAECPYKELAEEDSTILGAPKGHMREGVVIVPVNERRDPSIGRVILKYISARYWTSSND